MELAPKLNARQILAACYRRGVLFMPGDLFYTDGGGANTFRLGIGRVSEAEMATGFKIIGKLFPSLRRRKMRSFKKSRKLEHVCYDIRGPVMDEAKRLEEAGYDILKLNIGNPAPFGFDAPEVVIRAVRDNLAAAQGYTDSKGILPARLAIQRYCEQKGITGVEPDDIYIGNGVSELIVSSMQGLLDDGDEILIPAPDYPLWTAAVNLAGGTAVHYICDEQANWYPDLADLESKITPRTKGIVVINPNNPPAPSIPGPF